MAKLDYILGLYHPIKGDNGAKIFFSEDEFLNPKRHLNYLESFDNSEDFVESELAAPERTFGYKLRIFFLLQGLAIILAVFIFLVGAIQIRDWQKSQTPPSAKVQTSVPVGLGWGRATLTI